MQVELMELLLCCRERIQLLVGHRGDICIVSLAIFFLDFACWFSKNLPVCMAQILNHVIQIGVSDFGSIKP